MEQWIFPTLSLAGGIVGGLAGSYFSKRGEIRAVQTDLHLLLDQTRAMTTATKEIEAKISNDVWERQKRWDMKREATFEALKELGTFQAALTSIVGVYQGTSRHMGTRQVLPEIQAMRNKAYASFQESLGAFWRAKMLAAVVCGYNVLLKFSAVENIGIKIVNTVLENSEEVPDVTSFATALRDLVTLIREDLEQL
jgi:hypothetical protein